MVLGNHVGQQGSLVAPDRLRFDFSHGTALTKQELAQVSDILNESILDNLPISATEMAYKQAIDAGAMAFFSEKYGDVVRVVSVGAHPMRELSGPSEGAGVPPFSMELCGGTHVRQTGDIGSAVIVSDSAVSAGVRRMEVLTGRGALELGKQQSQQIADAARVLSATPDTLVEQAHKLATRLDEVEKQLSQARRDLAKARFDELLASVMTTPSGVHVLVTKVQADTADLLRDMADWYRSKFNTGGIIVLGAVINDKPALLAAVTHDLSKAKRADAGKLIKDIAPIIGGGGGGRPDLAQAGGKDADKLGEALDKARALVASI